MIELTREKVQLKTYGGLTGVRDKNDEPQRLIELPFTFVGSNDYLSMLDPTLKSSLYKKDESLGQIDSHGSGETSFRYNHIFSTIPVKKEAGTAVGAKFTIHYGINNEKSDIHLENATAVLKSVTPQDGGTCIYSFVAKGEASTADVGRIHTIMASEVEVSFSKAQQALDLED